MTLAMVTGKHVLSAVVGDNSNLFPEVLRLYVPPPARVLDMTWGNGVFWKRVDMTQYDVTKNDIDPERGDVHYDFTRLPASWHSFDAVVFDPPYKLTGTPAATDRYHNQAGAWRDVRQSYRDGIVEGWGALRVGGLLFVKFMDQVVSGKQEWYHRYIFDHAVLELGMVAEDLFVLVRPNPTPQPPGRTQRHADKNHSFLWVLRKR